MRHRPRAVVWTVEQIQRWRETGVRPAVAVWTAAQTAQFLTAIRGHRLYAAYHLIALRGLRRGEACGLRWCDIDLDNRVVLISRQIQRLGGLLVTGPPKTSRSMRAVALDKTTVAALRVHRVAQQAEAAAPGFVLSGFVFSDRKGQPLKPEYLYRTFMKLSAEAGLPPIRLHDLRHTAASLALQAGAGLKVISDQLGHASVVLTADTYISVEPDLAHQAAEATTHLILEAGRCAPGAKRPRRPAAKRRRDRRRPTAAKPATRAARPTPVAPHHTG